MIILDINVSKMNGFLNALRVQGSKTGLKINVEKNKRLRLRIGEDMMLGNKKIDQVDSFIYLGSTISKDGGCSEDFESRIVNSQGVFSQ